jgi:catechol 2,3-dioxygenase-like lactoylglutathione lyase family enzyme
MTHPRPFAHYGLTVPDVESAADWYEDVLGFDRLRGPNTVEAGTGRYGRLVADALGDSVGTVRIVHLATGGGAGLELFEFTDADGENSPDPTRAGYFHVGFADPDLEATLDRIVDTGGEQISDVWRIYPGQEYRMVYCTDPWGNIVELYSHDFERVHSNQE